MSVLPPPLRSRVFHIRSRFWQYASNWFPNNVFHSPSIIHPALRRFISPFKASLSIRKIPNTQVWQESTVKYSLIRDLITCFSLPHSTRQPSFSALFFLGRKFVLTDILQGTFLKAEFPKDFEVSRWRERDSYRFRVRLRACGHRELGCSLWWCPLCQPPPLHHQKHNLTHLGFRAYPGGETMLRAFAELPSCHCVSEQQSCKTSEGCHGLSKWEWSASSDWSS